MRRLDIVWYCMVCCWCMCFLFLYLFFFFQAEDGIRDRNVTGVQTCALPILGGGSFLPEAVLPANSHVAPGNRPRAVGVRSEERRVGKECRCRWWPSH